jgi:hypothetical protein
MCAENNRDSQTYAYPCGGTSCAVEGGICKSLLHLRIDSCELRINNSQDGSTSSVLVLTRTDPVCRRTPLCHSYINGPLGGVLRYFAWNLPNPFSRTMALASTQPLTETSTRNLPGGKGRPACKADKITGIYELIVWKMWEPRHLTILWASTAC